MQYATLRISGRHPAYEGHFPGNPVLPGAVLLDEVLFAIADSESLSQDSCTISAAKFKHVVGPGDALELGFERTRTGAFRFELRSAATVVAAGTVQYR